jgi:hypothetical protein
MGVRHALSDLRLIQKVTGARHKCRFKLDFFTRSARSGIAGVFNGEAA